MSVLEHSNLRDLLRVRDNEDDGRDALAGLTLAAVLGCESNPRRPSRTLLDIIKDEESGAAYRGLMPPPTDINDNRNSWKSFKNRLRIRRAGAAFSSSTSSHPVNACDISIDDCDIRISSPILVDRRRISRNTTFNSPRNSNSRTNSPPNGASVLESTTNITSTANSISPDHTSPRVEEEQRPAREEIGAEQRPASETGLSSIEHSADEIPARGEMVLNSTENPAVEGRNLLLAEMAAAPPRVSLMALLEETDWNVGGIAGSIEMEMDEVEEELEGETKDIVEGGESGGGEYVCCVCMVRHKGAAFIPCGHTFCRQCSRELWVNRGNCPLCNGFILEILDIF